MNVIPTTIIPAETARLLFGQYTHIGGAQVPRGLNRLRASSLCSFWCQHSTLNIRLVDVTPLGVSKAQRLSTGVTSSPIDEQEVTLIPLTTLGLKLPHAIRSLRPRVRSYYSFRDVIQVSIDEAFKEV